jgi:hypothetical protein
MIPFISRMRGAAVDMLVATIRQMNDRAALVGSGTG